MTFRLRGTVHDNDGKPVAGLTVRAEALQGFRGEQFVGQKEFEVTTGGTLGAASSALMQGNLDLASKMLWAATDVAPRDQKPGLGAAVRDLSRWRDSNDGA